MRFRAGLSTRSLFPRRESATKLLQTRLQTRCKLGCNPGNIIAIQSLGVETSKIKGNLFGGTNFIETWVVNTQINVGAGMAEK